ncbi:MAG TPA: BMP family ABC transporter substrate-binding protein [Paracoccaceae bacterium]|nr:BMP family ABC transporter substrate-binding protein [Paracoccaceae bacterium]
MRKTLHLAVTFLLVLFGSTVSAQEKPKVAFIYIAPVGETGWTFEHDRGRSAVEEKFGDRADFDYFELISEGPDGEVKMRELAQQGYDLIFATSYGYMNGAVQVAFEYPDVKIEHSTGFVRAKNLSTYNIRFYEGRVAQGIIGGHMTKTNKIGYIASFPIPEVIRGINAAFLAARSVNPDVEFEIAWANTWFNPELEGEIAQRLIDNGADILIQHTDSEAPTMVAEKNSVFSFGQASDMEEYGPNATLTSSINHWSPYYLRRLEAFLDGTWESTDTWDGLPEGMLEVGQFNDRIPGRVQEQAADAIARITAGRLHPFTGPIRRQDGSGWLASGEIASDHDLLTMNFFVEGITASIPR